MSWFGKIVGGTIGLALGGPLGAIAGAAFGHFFDTANQTYLEGGGPTLSPVEGDQMTFFVATFSMLAKRTAGLPGMRLPPSKTLCRTNCGWVYKAVRGPFGFSKLPKTHRIHSKTMPVSSIRPFMAIPSCLSLCWTF